MKRPGKAMQENMGVNLAFRSFVGNSRPCRG